MATGRATAYLRQKLVDHVNGVATYTTPATLALGFTTAAIPASANTYASISATECSGNGYAQTSVAMTGSTWGSADASGTASNTALVSCFTATANWTVAGVAFFFKDASGNLLYTGAIDVATPVLPSLGQIVTFPPGSIIINAAAAA